MRSVYAEPAKTVATTTNRKNAGAATIANREFAKISTSHTTRCVELRSQDYLTESSLCDGPSSYSSLYKFWAFNLPIAVRLLRKKQPQASVRTSS